MTNLPSIIESDLAVTLEGDFSWEILLTPPGGTEFSVRGRFDYNTEGIDPDTGELKVVNKPSTTIRKSTLQTVPTNGENWLVKPLDPVTGNPVGSFVFTPTSSLMDGKTIGFLVLPLQEAEQSP